MVVPAVYGTWVFWSEFGAMYRALSVVIGVALLTQLGLAVPIGVRPTRDVPWLRIGLIALAFLLACGSRRCGDQCKHEDQRHASGRIRR